MKKPIKNFEGMVYQGKKEGIDFLLCPRDGKSKCMNFTAIDGKYKHALEMFNDGGEKAHCRYCQTGAPKRQNAAKNNMDIVHARNKRQATPEDGVYVGNHKIGFKPRKIA